MEVLYHTRPYFVGILIQQAIDIPYDFGHKQKSAPA
jgi:hypothetical protein